jgi:hypothetical protein
MVDHQELAARFADRQLLAAQLERTDLLGVYELAARPQVLTERVDSSHPFTVNGACPASLVLSLPG